MIEATSAVGEAVRIRSVSVKKLFGLYDHTIPLNLEDRVTIIHGPNGVGKTKILTWIAALFRLDFSVFGGVPFQRFAIELTNGATLEIEPAPPDPNAQAAPTPRESAVLLVRQTDSNGQTSEQYVLAANSRKLVEIANPRLEFGRLGLPPPPDYHSQFQYLGLLGVPGARRTAEPDASLRDGPRYSFSGNVVLPELQRVSVQLVEAQRLLRAPTPDPDEEHYSEESFGGRGLAPTVNEYSRDIHRRIREALAEYARTSQNLDQTFPQRLIEYRSPTIDVEALKERMTTLEITRDLLSQIGLLDKRESSHSFDVSTLDRLEPERRLVLAVFVEDSEVKLQTLEDFARRIRIFLYTINEKFTNKRLSIGPETGFVAEDDTGRALDLDDLSSGEQHEIVLLYDLLFNVRPNTLVLIDEPELSLHITWQKRFLDDLLHIAETVGLDALVATHSPFIIGEREDLMVPLNATVAPRATSP